MTEGTKRYDVPADVIKRLAEIADAVSWQANIGGMEFAGQLVSVLARHPEMIDGLLEGGAGFILDNDIGAERGCLTFYSMNGKITTPDELHRAREVHKMKRMAKGQ